MSFQDILENTRPEDMHAQLTKFLIDEMNKERMRVGLMLLEHLVTMGDILRRFEEDVLKDKTVDEIDMDDVNFIISGDELSVTLNAILFARDEAERQRKVIGMACISDVNEMRSIMDEAALNES